MQALNSATPSVGIRGSRGSFISLTDLRESSADLPRSWAVAQSQSAAQGNQILSPNCQRPDDGVNVPPANSSALAVRVTASGEPVILIADLYLIASATNSSLSRRVLQRPVPVNATALWLPFPRFAAPTRPEWPLGDARLALFDSLARISIMGRAHQNSLLAAPTGILLTVSAARWALTGCSILELNATNAMNGSSCSASTAHIINLVTVGLSIDLGGKLRAGYVYRAAVSVEVEATPVWGAGPLISSTPAAANETVLDSSMTRASSSDAAASLIFKRVADMSRRTNTRRPSVPPLSLEAAPSAALLLETHLPPLWGSVSSNPSLGTTLLTPFTLTSSGWKSWGSDEAGVLGLSGPPPQSLLAVWIVGGSVPLSDSHVCAASERLGLADDSSWFGAASCEASLAGIGPGGRNITAASKFVLNVTGAPTSFFAPIWLRLLAIATQSSSSPLILDDRAGLALNPAVEALCNATSSWVQEVTAANYSLSTTLASPPLALQFRLQSDGVPPSWLPLLPSGLAYEPALLEAQLVFASSAAWPGSALSA